MIRHIKPSRLALAAALALSSFSAAAQPDTAKVRTMEAAARAHIAAFPGRSMHAADHSYVASDAIVDEDGAQHVRFQRSYRGLPVIGGDMVVHSDRNGNLRDVSLTLNRLINLPSRGAGLSAGRAIQAALNAHAGSTLGMRPELVVYARGDVPMLAWDVRVFSKQADGTPSEKHVIVDADAGAVLEAWDDIHTAAAAGTGKTIYSGNVGLTTDKVGSTYYLRDPSRGNTKTQDAKDNAVVSFGTIMTDADNIWGNNATSSRQSAAADAHYGGAVTWDYFKNVHGRNGIRNNGVGHTNVVHPGINEYGAYWVDDLFAAVFSDGGGATPYVPLDVVGHEMAHGVTASTAKLVYSGESGGLNEATSDIFGTMVEFYANNANDPGDFLIGEEYAAGFPPASSAR